MYKSKRNLHQPAHPTRARGSYQDLRLVLRCFPPFTIRLSFLSHVKVTSMASITTFCDSLNTAGFHQKQTTYSLVTMWTEGNSLWRPSASYLHTRSNIPKTSSSSEAITNVPVSTGYMAFTTNVRCICFLSSHVNSHSFPTRRVLRFLLLGLGKRRYNIKLWKTFTDCFNCLPIAAIIDEKIFTMHGGLSPDLQSMEQIRRVMRPTDVPDTGEC